MKQGMENIMQENELLATVDGFRGDLRDELVANAPSKMHRKARAGYVAALHAIEANTLPPAYSRPASIQRMQEAVANAAYALAK